MMHELFRRHSWMCVSFMIVEPLKTISNRADDWVSVLIRLQLLCLEFAIAFVIIAHINALHEQGAVVDLVGQGLFE